MRPSQVNDAARELMAAVRRWYENADWIDYGDVPTLATATRFTLAGNLASRYHVNRRVRVSATNTLYATITSVTFSATTAVTFEADSGSLSGSLSSIAVGDVAVQDSQPRAVFLQVSRNLAELSLSRSEARSALGIGSVGTQDAGSVSFSGGIINAVAMTNPGLTSASLSAAVIRTSVLEGCELGGSASISGGVLTGVAIRSATLSHCVLDNVTLIDPSMSGAIIVGASISGSNLVDCRFEGSASLEGGFITAMTLYDLEIQSATCSAIRVVHSHIKSSSLSTVTINSPVFRSSVGFDSYSLSASTTITWDVNLAQSAHLTLTGSTTISVNAPRAGYWYTLFIKYTTASPSIVWSVAFKWPGGTAPSLTEIGGGGKDLFQFYCPDGSAMFGVASLNFS